jgi:FkbM family methyltransferase
MTQTLKAVRRHPDLIYDFGLHRGEDTDFYLRKGFRVVAFEANPELVAECRLRFAAAIQEGRLDIIEGAIVDTTAPGPPPTTVTFYRNADETIWGTTDRNWAARNEALGTTNSVIEVPVVDLERVIVDHGIPYYMKIDIEGCDLICLRMLERFVTRPVYVSFESDKTSLANIRGEIDLLVRLGYDGFQAIEQSSIADTQVPPHPSLEGTYVEHRFEHGSSGLFGAELRSPWRSARRIRLQYACVRAGYFLLGDSGLMTRWDFPGAKIVRAMMRRLIRTCTGAPVPGWYDTHARHRDHAARNG